MNVVRAVDVVRELVQERLANARVPAEPAEVVRAQAEVDLLAAVHVVPQHARLADAHLALRGHLREQRHLPSVLRHDAQDAGVARELVKERERARRGRVHGGRDREGAVLAERVRVRRGGGRAGVAASRRAGGRAARGRGPRGRARGVALPAASRAESLLVEPGDAVVHRRRGVQGRDGRGGGAHEHERFRGVREARDVRHQEARVRVAPGEEHAPGSTPHAQDLLRRDGSLRRVLERRAEVAHARVRGDRHRVDRAAVRHADGVRGHERSGRAARSGAARVRERSRS